MNLADIAALIKRFEGLRLKSYLCPANVWTIGYGSTGPGIGPGLTWSKYDAELRMLRDAKGAMLAAAKASPSLLATDRIIAAIGDFLYNCGEGAYRASTLRRRLDAGDWAGVLEELPKWNKGGGRVLKGLVIRRLAEIALIQQELNK